MNDFLKKVFEQVVMEEPDTIKADKMISEDVKSLFASYQDSMDADEFEAMRNLIFCATLTAQEVGFELGIRYTLRLALDLFRAD